MVPVPLAGILPPVKVMVPPPIGALTVPPVVVLALPTTTTPLGKVSVKGGGDGGGGIVRIAHRYGHCGIAAGNHGRLAERFTEYGRGIDRY